MDGNLTVSEITANLYFQGHTTIHQPILIIEQI